MIPCGGLGLVVFSSFLMRLRLLAFICHSGLLVL